jgi:hypothetical protein
VYRSGRDVEVKTVKAAAANVTSSTAAPVGDVSHGDGGDVGGADKRERAAEAWSGIGEAPVRRRGERRVRGRAEARPLELKGTGRQLDPAGWRREELRACM